MRVKWWSPAQQERLGVDRAQRLEGACRVLDALADKPLRVYRELGESEDLAWGRVVWSRLADASEVIRPRLIPLREAIDDWATTYFINADRIKEIALHTLDIWNENAAAFRRREWIFRTTYMEGGPEVRVKKPQTWDPYVWTVLSQVLGWRSEEIAKWHNGPHHPPEYERAKRVVSPDNVRKLVRKTLDLIGLPSRTHRDGRPKIGKPRPIETPLA